MDIAAADTVAGRTVAAVDHTRADHIAAVGTEAAHTVVVVDHTVVAVGTAAAAPGNNQVDRIVLDTAAAEGDMVLPA